MSHLRKKIQKEFRGLYCEYVPIINENCLMFYKYKNGNRNFLFYYLYDKTKNIKWNINEIGKLFYKYGNVKPVKNCKYSIKYLDNDEFITSEEYLCKQCYYKVFCEK